MEPFRPLAEQRLFRAGHEALEAEDLDRAVEIYERLVGIAADSSNAWFNLGLAHKLRREWAPSARCNLRAAELDPENAEASWNLGIAATALGDWSTARRAWRNLDLDPGPGDGPPEMELGPTPVRLTSGEVVWGGRVDPCRARIRNVPLAESGHRWADVVLHDVVANGERVAFGRSWGVFDELIRLQRGPYETLECGVIAPAEEDSTALLARFDGHDAAAEDWTASVRYLCRTCSLGSPHEHRPEGDVAPLWLVQRRFGFAGAMDEIQALLEGWAADGSDRSFGPLRQAEPPDAEPGED